MKPVAWRKRRAGRAFTSDAPVVPFKKARTGFVGGGSAEMAAKTRKLMRYSNPQLSAALEATAPLQAFEAGAAVLGGGEGPPAPLQAFEAGAAVLGGGDGEGPPAPADKNSKKPTDLLSQIQQGKKLKKTAKTEGKEKPADLLSDKMLQKIANMLGLSVDVLKKNRVPKEEKKEEKPADLLSQIQQGKKLKKTTPKQAEEKKAGGLLSEIKQGKKLKKTTPKKAEEKKAEGLEAVLKTALSKKFGAAHASNDDKKLEKLEEKLAAYKNNKTTKGEEKLRARAHTLGERIQQLEKELEGEETEWDELLKDADGHGNKKHELARLKEAKEMIEKALKS